MRYPISCIIHLLYFWGSGLAIANFVEIAFHVQEHDAPNVVFGNLFRSLHLNEIPIHSITFESPPVSEWSHLFLIDSLTGDLKTAPESRTSIDRETICPTDAASRALSDCRVSIVVSINQKFLVSLHIIIDDINDSPPRFTRNGHPLTEITLVIPEDAKVGKFTRPLPPALDPDLESASVAVDYDIVGSELPFALDISAVAQPRLLVSAQLDYEQTSEYAFFLRACEPAVHKPLCSSLHVTVNIENANDNHPVFSNATYRTVINEDIPIGSTVLTVVAVDADKPPFANISYFMSTSSASKVPFAVDETTGRIFPTSSPLEPRQYSFIIEATDEPDNVSVASNHASTLVVIHVADVNNHRPRMEVQQAINKTTPDYLTPEGAFVVELQEEAKEPAILAYLTVTDADHGENAICSCRLDDTPLSKMFELTKVNQVSPQKIVYRLVAQKGIDAEDPTILDHMIQPLHGDLCKGVAGFLPLSVKCIDSGVTPLEAVETIFVGLKDLDEYPTEFSLPDESSVLRLVIPEDTKVGTSLLDLVIIDKDAGKCTQFSMSGPDTKYALIDTLSGTLVLARPLDYEKIKSISFHVHASERFSETGKTTTVLVIIEIANVNDNPPCIVEPQKMSPSACEKIKEDLYDLSIQSNDCYAFEVTEEVEAGFFVGRLVAKDEDDVGVDPGRNGGPIFSLVGAYASAFGRRTKRVPVSCLKVTEYGSILVSARLDREKFGWIDLIVSLSDGEQASTAVVRVHLLDINDNAPLWQFPTENDHHISVSILAQVGAVISRVQALDADSGIQNSALEYSILPREKPLSALADSSFQKYQLSQAIYGAHLFTIDPNTGQLLVNQTLPERTDLNYRLDILVRDKGTPQHESLSHLLISLSDKPFLEMPSHAPSTKITNNLQNDGVAENVLSVSKLITDDPDPSVTSPHLENWIHIVGISAGILAFLLFIAILSFIFFRRMQSGSRSLCHKTSRQIRPVDSHPRKRRSLDNASPILEGRMSNDVRQPRSSILLQRSSASPAPETTTAMPNHLPLVGIPACSIACAELMDMSGGKNGMPIIVSVSVLPETQFSFSPANARGPEYMLLSDRGSDDQMEANNLGVRVHGHLV